MPHVKEHLRSLPYREAATSSQDRGGVQCVPSARLCLRFVVLTAARSGEARGATWEVDAREWSILGAHEGWDGAQCTPERCGIHRSGPALPLRDDSDLVFRPPVVQG